MKYVLFCNIPMKAHVDKTIYNSTDLSLPVSETPVIYPVSAFLEKTLHPGDEVKVILLVKDNGYGNSVRNAAECKSELTAAFSHTNATAEFKTVTTDFNEDRMTHNSLLLQIVEQLEDNAHIIADITYGPKDLPIVLFAALNFAQKHFDCEIDNIIYGQADFEDGKPTNTRICDMIPLYSLNSLTNTVRCHSSSEAKKMLKTLLSV